ncbi:MAG: dicarboxylate/amino acid:cation symporter [Rickettsiaceae bacterium H1]|nr:dicarboxylate/amino acid:cation symporter [Rickettsiaceae bacterium H1]
MRSPLLLLFIVALSLLFHSYLPISVKSFLYALSLSVKELLLFIIPFIIFFCIFNSVIKLQSNAVKLMTLIVAMVFISNFFSTWIAYGVSEVFGNTLKHASIYNDFTSNVKELHPFWEFSLPAPINSKTSIISALLIGSFIAFLVPKIGGKVSTVLVKIIDIFLYKALSPIIPIFIIGFTIKLAHDQVLFSVIKHYSFIFLIIFGSSVSYILVWHLIILRCEKIWIALRNLILPLFTGFSTMSSMIAMPLLIMAVEKNVKEKKIVNAIIPSITNFHLIGDCFAIPILALTIINTFNPTPLNIYQYLMFSIYFITAKFAVVAVPGGGILVMLPILKSTMGFSDAMLSLITILYIIFDSIITPINIFGNSAFSMLTIKIYNKLSN